MPKFEKKFVHFMWNDELKGKKVFYSDYVDKLKEYVENNKDSNYVVGEGTSNYPFEVDYDTWTFVYYDPNYELKLAYEQGKTIQFRDNENYEWQDIKTPDWRGGTKYRIKPEETKEESFVTKRELAMWIAKGNGEWNFITGTNGDSCLSHYPYSPDESDIFISALIVIRKWEDTEWVSPTREYMGLED